MLDFKTSKSLNSISTCTFNLFVYLANFLFCCNVKVVFFVLIGCICSLDSSYSLIKKKNKNIILKVIFIYKNRIKKW